MDTGDELDLQPGLDVLPPSSVDAEAALLGSLMGSPDQIVDAMQVIRSVEFFFDLRHRTVWQVLVDLHDYGAPIDMISIVQALRDRFAIGTEVQVDYVAALPDRGAPGTVWRHYAQIVRDKYALRGVVQAATQARDLAMGPGADATDILDQVGTLITDATNALVDTVDRDISSIVRGAIDRLEQSVAHQGEIHGIATGFHDLDRLTLGLEAGDMAVLAGRPSTGKTTMAMTIAIECAVRRGIPCAVFSLETPDEMLAIRMLANIASVPLRTMRQGYCDEQQLRALVTASGRLGKAPLRIIDRSGMSVMELRARARKLHRKHGIRLFILDYLQLISSAGRAQNRQEAVQAISRGIQTVARELKVPWIVLAQLNREIEKEKFRKPRMADLRESGSIEQDADHIWLLYRKPTNEEDDRDIDGGDHDVGVVVAKNRNGEIGEVSLKFETQYVRYSNQPLMQ